MELSLAGHLSSLRAALTTISEQGGGVGLATPVPTTPGWTLHQLLAHTGSVHRWAAACLRGHDADKSVLQRQGLAVADPLSWLNDGGLALLETLESAPEDVHGPVFLDDAGSPRHFWARRQNHETTIHAVDVLAARLGRRPVAEDTEIERAVALDGIDELLTGFLPRPGLGLRVEEPTSFAVRPSDAASSWLVGAEAGSTVTARDAGPRALARADVALTGSATTLYLALWNRTDEIGTGDLARWREAALGLW